MSTILGCFTCGGVKAPEDTLCKKCFENPDAYDLYVMRFQELSNAIVNEKEKIKCPCCNATVLSLSDHYSRSIRCSNASNLSRYNK